tara:strand:+ start:1456 stop:1923 length:468 start_codon:yes stop_codon:yes gene_type:complete
LYSSQNLSNNIIIHDKTIILEDIVFKDFNLQDIDLADNKGNIVILNFWATWCAPCKKEMPSLSLLKKNLPKIEIFAINLEKPNKEKTRNFFNDLQIDNLKIYFDPNFDLAKKFKMRGLPTSILIDKNGNEFGRIIGEVNFNEKKLLKFLKEKINS